jgi:hypothetical protein
MDADFSIELGADDPVLDFPWSDPSGKFAYYNVKQEPALLTRLPETARFPELASFLRMVNGPASGFESAKCDVWETTELGPEEHMFDAAYKFASYVDLVSSDAARRVSFDVHEDFLKRLTELLRRAPETQSSAEVCARRCYFRQREETEEGFCCTVYVSGYGADEAQARLNWGIGLKLVGNAILQLSAARFG